MTKMEICSESEDLQTSKLNEFILVAHRVKKVGRGVRLGLGKNKLRPNSSGGARASFLTGSENLLTANGSIDLSALKLNEAPSKPSSPHPGGRDQQGGKDRERKVGELGRSQGQDETPAHRQGYASRTT
jgi:hypothetical protein